MEFPESHAPSCQASAQERTQRSSNSRFGLVEHKSATGIAGFDSITRGGLPRGRISLVSGEIGTGKTSFGLEFVVHGALDSGEAGIFVSACESISDLVHKTRSLGCPIDATIGRGLVVLVSLRHGQRRHSRCADVDLAKIFTGILCMAARTRARRLCIDGFEVPYGHHPDAVLLRTCLTQMAQMTDHAQLTTLLTCEPGLSGTFSRSGRVEYSSDCVVVLAHEKNALDAYRYLRIVKYRGSAFEGGNHFFMIGENGVDVRTHLADKASKYEIASHMTAQRLSTPAPTIGLYL